MWAWLAITILLAAGTPTAPRKAKPHVSATFEIEGKRVSEAEFNAKKSSLEGSADYHCKKTTFGGVASYKAHDRDGHWFQVVQVSGSGRPSTIDRSSAPEHEGNE